MAGLRGKDIIRAIAITVGLAAMFGSSTAQAQPGPAATPAAAPAAVQPIKDPFKDTYAGYVPVFVRQIEQNFAAAFGNWKADAEKMKLSSETSFFADG